MIPKNELKEGWYICEGRCPPVCYWDGKHFHNLRPKFGTMYHSEELHWDDDPKFGTVKPMYTLEEVARRGNLYKLL